MIEFKLPSLGADMDDGRLVEWQVAPGDAVARGQVIGVVETQKGAIDLDVWTPGTIAALPVGVGQRVAVGRPIALIAEPGEDWRDVARRVEEAAATAAVGAASAAASAADDPRRDAALAGSAAPATVPAAAAQRDGADAPRISPAARRRAAELGLDPAALQPARADAPVSLADVERAAAAPPADTADAAAAPDRAAGMRAAIAAAMTRSKREIPHYYLGCEIDVEQAHQRLEALNRERPIAARLLFAALALHAVAAALRDAPALNGRFEAGRFTPSASIHLGVVASLRGGGLVVPALADADRRSPDELMAALRELLQRARAGTLRSSDLSRATATVSNLGELGVETVYGVIYPPQVALIGIGRVAQRAVVRDGALAAARTVQVTLAADHRASDGLVGARFLSALRARLEQPQRWLS